MSDGLAILALRSQPAKASESSLAPDDLLQRVDRAMREGGLPHAALVASLPQPPRARPGTQHTEMATRLVFEDIELEPLVRFGYRLTADDSFLRISAIHLRAAANANRWNADVSVAWTQARPVAPSGRAPRTDTPVMNFER